MNEHFVLAKLRDIMIEVFYPDSIPEDISNLKIGDIPQWDSLGNFNLLLECESEFNCQFPIESMPKFISIASIMKHVLEK